MSKTNSKASRDTLLWTLSGYGVSLCYDSGWNLKTSHSHPKTKPGTMLCLRYAAARDCLEKINGFPHLRISFTQWFACPGPGVPFEALLLRTMLCVRAMPFEVHHYAPQLRLVLCWDWGGAYLAEVGKTTAGKSSRGVILLSIHRQQWMHKFAYQISSMWFEAVCGA